MRRKWTKQKIIDKILELHNAGENLSSSYMDGKYRPLKRASEYHFGNWKNAIEVAGLDYCKICKRKKWSKKKIVRTILKLYKAGVNLSSRKIRKKDSSLFGAARIHFGSWKNTIEAAGLDYDEIRKREFWNKGKVVERILKLHEADKDLSYNDVERNYPALMGGARRRFGSWKEAIEAAGLDYNEIDRYSHREKWDGEKVIGWIQKLHDAGENLSWSYLEKKQSSLIHAALKHFGGWKEAIEAAGLDYNEINRYSWRKEWSKDIVIEKILELREREEYLDSTNIRNKYPPIYGAARRNFGSWKDAIEAAGLDYDEIKKDIQLQPLLGSSFQKYVEEILKITGRNVKSEVWFKDCRTDFVDIETGEWMDAKLSSWTESIAETAKKYLQHTDTLTIYYLRGEHRRWANNRVVFKCVKEFYPKLKELGRDDIIKELSLIEKGVVPGKYQKELDEYMEKDL